ncbi:MAG: SRPBCC family protein [Anaerolineae bacterium]|nr:SRPBCC family protein [Anaerolineae bacterium]
MSSVTKTEEIEATKEQVWSILADLETIQNYNPVVARSYYTSQTKEGVGATRHCDFSPMGSVEERVVSWKDGECYSVEVYESRMMPIIVTAHFHLHAQGGRTTVKLVMDYKMKGGKLGALAEKPMQPQVAKMAESMLSGLKRYVETGQPLTAETLVAA